MTMKDLLVDIEQLSLEEQLTLLEALTRRIRSTVKASQSGHLRGILRPEGELTTDTALKQDYIDYIEEKYR